MTTMRNKIIDKRNKKNILLPELDWIPDGVENTIVNIVDKDSNVLGDLEIGSDSFVQGIWNIDGVHWRLEHHPPLEKAVLKAWGLR